MTCVDDLSHSARSHVSDEIGLVPDNLLEYRKEQIHPVVLGVLFLMRDFIVRMLGDAHTNSHFQGYKYS